MLKFVNINNKTERLIRDTFSEKELEQAARQYQNSISTLDPLSDISFNEIFEAPRLLINYNSTKAWFVSADGEEHTNGLDTELQLIINELDNTNNNFEKVAKELGISASELKKQYYQCKKGSFWSFNELNNEIAKKSKIVSIDYKDNNVVLSIRGVWDDYQERISGTSREFKR